MDKTADARRTETLELFRCSVVRRHNERFLADPADGTPAVLRLERV